MLALALFPILFSLFPEASQQFPFGHSREPSKRYRQEIQSDALASLSLRLGYVNWSYGFVRLPFPSVFLACHIRSAFVLVLELGLFNSQFSIPNSHFASRST